MIRKPWFTFDDVNSVGLDKIPVDSNIHIKDYDGNGTPKQITVVDITDLGGSIITIADLLNATTQYHAINNTMLWRGYWGSGFYKFNEVTRDGSWTSVVVNPLGTVERPSPQPSGAPEDSMPDDSEFSNGSYVGIVRMVHLFTMNESGFINSFEVNPYTWLNNEVNRITLKNLTSGESLVVDNMNMAPGQWNIVDDSGMIARAGDEIQIEYAFYNSNTNEQISGKWISEEDGATPGTGEFHLDDLADPTVIQFNHTDDDGGDRTLDLQGVLVNSLISISQTNDATRYITFHVDAVDITNPTYTIYTGTTYETGSKNLQDNADCIVTFNSAPAVPSEYHVIADFYDGVTNQPGFATITSQLYFDGVQQADVNDAYGLLLRFQESYISDDWQILSLSSGAGGSTDLTTKQDVLQSAWFQIDDVSPSDGATETFDYTQGDLKQITCPALGTITIAFSGFLADKVSTVLLDLVNGGNSTVVWPVDMLFAGGLAPVLTVAGTDRLMITKDKDNLYTLAVVGTDIKVTV